MVFLINWISFNKSKNLHLSLILPTNIYVDNESIGKYNIFLRSILSVNSLSNLSFQQTLLTINLSIKLATNFLLSPINYFVYNKGRWVEEETNKKKEKENRNEEDKPKSVTVTMMEAQQHSKDNGDRNWRRRRKRKRRRKMTRRRRWKRRRERKRKRLISDINRWIIPTTKICQ